MPVGHAAQPVRGAGTGRSDTSCPICVQTTVDGLSMTGFKVIVLADACASQAIGALSAEQAHAAAIQRMAYLFAAAEDTATFVAKVRALQPAAG